MKLRRTIDTADLPAGEARTLQRLVADSSFFQQPAKITTRTRQPDRFQYTLRIQDGDRVHTVVVHEEVMPQNLKPLIARLSSAVQHPSP